MIQRGEGFRAREGAERKKDRERERGIRNKEREHETARA